MSGEWGTTVEEIKVDGKREVLRAPGLIQQRTRKLESNNVTVRRTNKAK